ncbi:MAG: putative acetyltransferase [Thermoleophilia bacterium]|nr:putative acetyltransferase [Thermoleophilia bacterium]
MSTPGAVNGTMQVPYTSLETRRPRMEAMIADPDAWLLVAESVDSGTVVGNLGIHRMMRPRRAHVAELGMSVHDDWHGRGVGTALMAAAVDLADRWLQVRRIELDVYPDNVAAVRLYEKFGFEVEGRKREAAFRDGRYADIVVMGRLRR